MEIDNSIKMIVRVDLIKRIEEMEQQIDLLFEKVSFLRESIIKLEKK